MACFRGVILGGRAEATRLTWPQYTTFNPLELCRVLTGVLREVGSAVAAPARTPTLADTLEKCISKEWCYLS